MFSNGNVKDTDMKRALLAALFLLPTPVLAQTTITVSVGNVSEKWDMTADDQAKFEAWVQWTYKCGASPVVMGNPAMPPPAPRQDCTPLTLGESETLWAKGMLQGTADNVTKYQNAIVSAAAVSQAKPIGFQMNGPAKEPKKGPPPGPPPDATKK
jgi:hypothetical protein